MYIIQMKGDVICLDVNIYCHIPNRMPFVIPQNNYLCSAFDITL